MLFSRRQFLGAASSALLPPPAARPNVVLVMTDDQGYGDLACHGNPVLQTPHLDALHAQSVRLTNY
ncbi:MAG: sulfatase-like hydrolase/transferase, partial [Acidobacteriaceae bacterium]|nr:sulfatase-like hydrolase/transferase [Acidobacteriaceae bacterium]